MKHTINSDLKSMVIGWESKGRAPAREIRQMDRGQWLYLPPDQIGFQFMCLCVRIPRSAAKYVGWMTRDCLRAVQSICKQLPSLSLKQTCTPCMFIYMVLQLMTCRKLNFCLFSRSKQKFCVNKQLFSQCIQMKLIQP